MVPRHHSVFNGGRLRAGVEIAEAQRDQSYATFHQVVLRALEDVENALVGLAQQRLRYQRLAVAARSNREAGRLARVLYQQGASSFLEVLDTERSLYDSEDSLLQSQVLIATPLYCARQGARRRPEPTHRYGDPAGGRPRNRATLAALSAVRPFV